MLSSLLRHRSARAAVIALVVCAILLPLSTFLVYAPIKDKSDIGIAGAMKAITVIVVFVIVYYLLHAIERLKAGDPVYRRWLRVSLVCLAVNAVILLLIWPGFWTGASYGILRGVEANQLPTWQSPLTTIYFAVVVNLIPTGVAIPIVQAVVASLAVGYVVARTADLLAKPRWAYLLVIPFCFIPVVLQNFYPMRISVYAYIEVLVLFRFVLLWLRPEVMRSRPREFAILSVFIALLAFWRSEGVYYLVAIPVLALVLFRPWRKAYRDRRVMAGALAAIAGVAIVYGVSAIKADQSYQVVSTTLNPLSVMLQGDLKGDNLTEDLAVMDEFFDLDVVRKYPDADGIPAHDKGAERDDAREHISEYNRAFLDLVLNNPQAFFDARMQTFEDTNFGTGKIPHINRADEYLGTATDGALGSIEWFRSNNALAQPWNADLRNSVVLGTMMVDPESASVTPFGVMVWNVIPALVVAMAGLVIAAFRRSWLFAVLFASTLLRAALVFATAPANYSMYYLSTYLNAWFLAALGIVLIVGRYRRGTSPGDEPVTIGTRTAEPHSVHEPS